MCLRDLFLKTKLIYSRTSIEISHLILVVMARVYISSTYADLIEARKVVADAVLTLEHLPIGMEHYTASERAPLDKCLEDVRSCQVYIALIAWRYGFIPRGKKKSITQLEYEEAGRCGIPRLIFLLDADARWSARFVDKKREPVENFRSLLEQKHLVTYFLDEQDLFTSVSAALTTQVGIGKNIPELLPFLVNRTDQGYELSQVLNKFREKDSPNPILCVVHGDQSQSHDMLRRRFIERDIPSFIGDWSSTEIIHAHPLKWPTKYSSRTDCHNRLMWHLSQRILGRPAPAEEVYQYLAEISDNILIHSHMQTEGFAECGIQLIEDYIHFWQEWKKNLPYQKLIILLFISYQQRYSGLHGLLNFHKRRKFSKLNQEILLAINSLQEDAFKNLVCKVLPILDGISQLEAEEWVREDVEPLGFCDINELMKRIEIIYSNWERIYRTDKIPMESLAGALKNMLYSCN